MAPPRGPPRRARRETKAAPLSPPRKNTPATLTVDNPPPPPVLEPVVEQVMPLLDATQLQASPERVPLPLAYAPGMPPVFLGGLPPAHYPGMMLPPPGAQVMAMPPMVPQPAPSFSLIPPPPETVYTGVVTNFGSFRSDTNANHRYGFIRVDHTTNEVFVSEQDAPEGYLTPGDRCEFRIVDAKSQNRRTGARQWKAMDVVVVSRAVVPPYVVPPAPYVPVQRVSPQVPEGTLLPPGAFAPLLLEACGCGAHLGLLRAGKIDDRTLFETITFEDLQAAGLPAQDGRRVMARLEQLKGPPGATFPSLHGGVLQVPVADATGYSQAAQAVTPDVVVEKAAPAPAPTPPEKRKKRPAKRKEPPAVKAVPPPAPEVPAPPPPAPEVPAAAAAAPAPALTTEDLQLASDMALAMAASQETQESSWSSVVKKDRKGRRASRNDKANGHSKKEPAFESFELDFNGRNALEGCRLYKDSIDENLEKKLASCVDDMLRRDANGSIGGHPFQGGRQRKLRPGQSRTDVQAGPKFDDYKNQQILTEGDTLRDGSLFTPEPMPPVAQELHDGLVRRGVLNDDAPFADIFLANVYEKGQFTLNHTDAKYIQRPLIVTSLLSSGTIVFGKKLTRDQEKNGSTFFGKSGSLSKQITLPARSTLVLEGPAADYIQHAINGVDKRRMSILMRIAA